MQQLTSEELKQKISSGENFFYELKNGRSWSNIN